MRANIDYNKIEAVCEGNTVIGISFTNKEEDITIIEFKNAKVKFVGLSEREFRSTHCSCVKLKKAHWHSVRDILKKCLIASRVVYIETDDKVLLDKIENG